MKSFPGLAFEEKLWNQDVFACGIDEVGRGSFAGPLVVGAVVLKKLSPTDLSRQHLLSLGINDSKLVSKKNRHQIIKIAQEYILLSSIQYISVDIINEKGVGEANKLGFQMAAQDILKKIKNQEVSFLTDAFKIPGIITTRQKNIIRGDATSVTIALASILAKVERDTFMETLAEENPLYGFEKHKGYGTLLHRTMIKQHGPTPHHRTQFISAYI